MKERSEEFETDAQIDAEALRIHQQTVVTRVMPIGNLTTVQIAFSEDVNVAAEDLTVAGTNVPAYSIVDFEYDLANFTAAS